MKTGRPNKRGPKIKTENIKEITRTLFKTRLLVPAGGIKFHLYNKTFYLSEDDCNNIAMILRNSYCRNKTNTRFSREREVLVKVRLQEMLEFAIDNVSKTSAKPYELAYLTKMYKDLVSLNVDKIKPGFFFIREICRRLRYDITDNEILGLVNEFAPVSIKEQLYEQQRDKQRQELFDKLDYINANI